ncbi:Helix-turn-helix [Desulfocicer vacuolatum DSM 3385]|uniref:Helix-turn-helix n=2 Tax=Desulfocicer vacuolatum TaxID=2298 RepID=A0A1W1Z1T4_9BACT|nr:Helix-turn-helix [Desulfocicer vacuolatum DSM 3385]
MNMPEDKRFMSIDEHLKIIQEKYNHLAGRLHQSETLKDAVSIEKTGEVVRAARKSQGLTRKALCQLSGVSYSTLNKVETGSVSIRLDIMMKIVKTLGLNLWIG